MTVTLKEFPEGLKKITQFGVEYPDGQIEWATIREDVAKHDQSVTPHWAKDDQYEKSYYIQPTMDTHGLGFPKMVIRYRRHMEKVGAANVRDLIRVSRSVIIVTDEVMRESPKPQLAG